MDVDTQALTPVERHGDYFVKRDDLFAIPEIGVCGGKARACWTLAQNAAGLVTGCSRLSPQQQLTARIAKLLGIPCHVHTALGKYTTEMTDAVRHGAKISQWYNGFSVVLSRRAKDDADASGWTNIPFGMESEVAVNCAKHQVDNIPTDVPRIVVPIGSGISVAGILHGLRERGLEIPVLGVRVGGGYSGRRIKARLNKYGPVFWQRQLTIVQASVPYEKAVNATASGLGVDYHYEAKCIEFLQPGDLFWVVGRRPELVTRTRNRLLGIVT